MEQKYEALFTPWKIGNVEIKNRIVMCPMGGTSLFGWFELGGCHFDKEAANLFLERAKNNVGLIIPGIAGYLIMQHVRFHGIMDFVLWVCGYVMIYGISMWIFSMDSYEKNLILQPMKKLLGNGKKYDSH